MRKTLLFSVLLILATLSIFLIKSIVFPSEKKLTIASPIPDFLTIFTNKQVSSLTLWLPSLENKIDAGLNTPNISARSALVFDVTSKETIYSLNPTEKLPMASLTKIMTAIVAMENKRKDDRYVVSGADLVGENSMGLNPGESLSLEELLYGLMLRSGNDAAEVFASNYPGGRESFIKAMNKKAESMGLKNTHFTNPSGLEGDGNQYTTAYDMVVMTRYALVNFPLFGKVAATFDHTIPQTLTHKEYFLENETNLISSYPGVKGVKTGYTPEAGFCLVTYLDFGGHQIIAIILNSENRRQEMKDLLDYSLKSLGIDPPIHG